MVYNDNLEAIKLKDISFYEKLVECSKSEEFFSPQTIASKSGMNITQVDYNGKKVCLNSVYNPINEAKMFLSKMKNVYEYSSVTIFGLANGIIVNYLIENMPQTTKFVIFEPCFEIFQYALSEFDLTPIINNENIFIANIEIFFY